MTAPRIAAIVPAYNEEAAITAVVNDIRAVAKAKGLHIDVLVVNDCSTDNTASIIEKLDCIPLHLPVNLGIGGAVQTGFKYAFENGYDHAVQVDGDGQHPAEDIPNLYYASQQNALDVAIGSRFISKQGFQSTSMRRAGIKYFRRINRMLTGLDITDSTSGFRMLNRKALEVVSEYYPDEYPEPEAIVLYAHSGLKVGEVPVVMKPRQGGVSSINSFSSMYYMLKVSLAIFFTFIRLKSLKTSWKGSR
jgi:glycosyltransferase involved in cell wall biosynthesis